MSELIRNQLQCIFFMIYCGMTVGIITELFHILITRISKRKISAIIIRIMQCVVTAYIIGEFLLYADNGKVSILAVISILAGVLLWLKFFYGIIAVGDENGEERQKTKRI